MIYPSLLPQVYKLLTHLSRGHGAQTLARLDSKIFPGNRSVNLSSGVAMKLASDPHLFGYLLQNHENHIKTWIADNAPSASSFVDVGANIGYFTGIAISYLPPGSSVYSIEPDIENFQACAWLEKAATNRNINLHRLNCAVGEQSGELFLNRHPKFCTYHTVYDTPKDKNKDLKVDCISLHELADSIKTGEIDCLKVDVEGYEEFIMRGSTNLFKQRRIRTAMIEVTPGSCATVVFEMAELAGYRKTIWHSERWQEWLHSNQLNHRTDVCLVR